MLHPTATENLRRITAIDIITCEYPPEIGGVAAYSLSLACALAERGICVRVISASNTSGKSNEASITVHRLGGGFTLAGLLRMERIIGQYRPERRVLVQYVPTGYGWLNMNLPFCLWIFCRWHLGIDVMFHEAAISFSPKLHINMMALVNRAMGFLATRGASRIFVSTPAWRPLLTKLAGKNRTIEWLPVPSNMPAEADPALMAAVGERFGSGGPLLGHFGIHPARAPLLQSVFEKLARSLSGWRAIFVGQGSHEFLANLITSDQTLVGRVYATGELAPKEVAAHLALCDLAVQPYPDGVTSRRGSTMAWLCLGVPVVTNVGHLSEAFWMNQGIVLAAQRPDAAQIADLIGSALDQPLLRASVAEKGRSLYRSSFSMDHTIDALLCSNAEGPFARETALG